jgi:hypothetical protein
VTEIAFTPWSTAEPMFQGAAPTWVPESDQARVRSYELYEQMYWQHRNTFKLVQRGTNAQPIYIPNPRIVVDTSARYVAKGLGFNAQPMADPGAGVVAGNQADATLAREWFNALFAREKFMSRFAANKLYGLMRGDWIFHITGNENKAEGRRLSLLTVNPGSYFPIYGDVTDPESLQAVILADLFTFGGKQFVRRQLYRRTLNTDGTYTISSELALFNTDPEKWLNLEGVPETVEGFKPIPRQDLDDRIQAIPVYHIPNNPAPNQTFGNSELRGMEILAGAVNQSISDQELVLVFEGLGIYATDAGSPTDDEGNDVNWVLGPGRVLEHDPDHKFYRVNGVSSVGPFLDHVRYIESKMGDATGANEAAIGKVDVQVAESGVALALRLGPLLSRAEYMETFITDTTVNMWFDIGTMWLPVYEGQDFPGIAVRPTYGSKLPLNRKEKFNELVQMHTIGVITTEFFLDECAKLGYEFPDGTQAMAKAALAEQQARTDAAMPTDRVNQEAEAEGGSSTQELVTT